MFTYVYFPEIRHPRPNLVHYNQFEQSFHHKFHKNVVFGVSVLQRALPCFHWDHRTVTQILDSIRCDLFFHEEWLDSVRTVI